MAKHLNAIAVCGVKSCGEMTFSKPPCHTEPQSGSVWQWGMPSFGPCVRREGGLGA
jgi:hypothetical protein